MTWWLMNGTDTFLRPYIQFNPHCCTYTHIELKRNVLEKTSLELKFTSLPSPSCVPVLPFPSLGHFLSRVPSRTAESHSSRGCLSHGIWVNYGLKAVSRGYSESGRPAASSFLPSLFFCVLTDTVGHQPRTTTVIRGPAGNYCMLHLGWRVSIRK